jgi:hypothetical protein
MPSPASRPIYALNSSAQSKVPPKEIRGNPHLRVTIQIALPNHPSKQIDFGHHSQGTDFLVHTLRHDRRAIPLEKLVQIAQTRVLCDFDKFASRAGLLALAVVQVQAAQVLDDFVEFAEVKHDGFDGGFGICAACGNVGEEVAEGDEADETGFACGRGDGDGELVEAFFAHGFDGFAAGGGGGDGGDGLEAQGGNGGALEGILFGDGVTAGNGLLGAVGVGG